MRRGGYPRLTVPPYVIRSSVCQSHPRAYMYGTRTNPALRASFKNEVELNRRYFGGPTHT